MLGQKQHKVSKVKGDILAPHFCTKTSAYGQAKPSSHLYPFGSSMVSYKNVEYTFAYGLNGQEKEDDVFEGAYSAEYWMYDSRLGRRWNIDPVVKAHESPYATFGNNPVWFVDPNGADTSVSVTTSATQDVYSSSTSSTTVEDESIDESDDRFQNILSQNRDLNPVPNSPNVSYSNLRIQTQTTVTNHTTTTVTYNADGRTTEETVMTTTVTTTKRILFDVSNNLGNSNMVNPISTSYSFGLSSSTTDPKTRTIGTPMYMKTFVNAGMFERNNTQAGVIRTLNTISGVEGAIANKIERRNDVSAVGLSISIMAVKSKNPYVGAIGLYFDLQAFGAQNELNYLERIHNSYSIHHGTSNWNYTGGNIAPIINVDQRMIRN